MKHGIRKPSPSKSVRARTTGRAKRTVRRMADPTYGKKGAGAIKNPRKSAYNAVYGRTTRGISDLGRASGSSKKNRLPTSNKGNSSAGRGGIIAICLVSGITCGVAGIPFMIIGSTIGVLLLAFAVSFLLVTVCQLIMNFMEASRTPDTSYAPYMPSAPELRDAANKQEAECRTAKINPPPTYMKFESKMNCKRYKFSGRDIKTGRISGNRRIFIFEGDDIEEEIKKLGYEEPIRYEETAFTKASKSMTSTWVNVTHYTAESARDLSGEDVRAIIDGKQTKESPADEGLFQYMKRKRIAVSLYGSESHVCNKAVKELPESEKTLFWIYTVYCNYKSIPVSDLESDKLYQKFRSCNKELRSNKKFMDSVREHERGFMFWGPARNGYGGTSRNIAAYQIPKKYFAEHGM